MIMPDKDSHEELSVEQAFSQLERILSQLENGQVTLEEAVKLYQQGSSLLKFCEHKIAAAEQQVLILDASTESLTAYKVDNKNL